MLLITKQELYDYLNTFDYKKVLDTPLSSVYFLIEYTKDKQECKEMIYFTFYDGIWIEAPCYLERFRLDASALDLYVAERYEESVYADARAYEETLQRAGWHYDIQTPQVLPFLPDTVKIVAYYSDSACLDWLLANVYSF